MNFIEALEPRIAPAILTPTVVKGVLILQHDNGDSEDLVVTQTAPDTFTVVDARPLVDTDYGPFTGVKSIAVTFGGSGSALDLKVSTAGLAGTLSINATGGNNTYTLHTADNVSGQIVGKVTVTGGNGNDALNINGGLAIGSPVIFDGHDGLDSFTPSNAYLTKKLTLESVEDITTQGSGPVVIGSMLVENEEANGGVIFILNHVATIAGKLTYCGSETAQDDVTLNGQVAGSTLLMLFGGVNNVNTAGTYSSGLTITGGTGNDTVVFHRAQINFSVGSEEYVNANVGGPLTMKLGAGTNAVTFEQNAFFAKAIALTTGAGADTVNLTKFVAAKGMTLTLGNGVNTVNGSGGAATNAFIGGALKYIGGADTDTVGLNAVIASTINVNLGNGTNGATGTARVTGKSATFLGGTGTDTLNIAILSMAATLTVKLGAGDDMFTFGGGALAKAMLDGGAGANDTINGVALLPAVRKITGFETQN